MNKTRNVYLAVGAMVVAAIAMIGLFFLTSSEKHDEATATVSIDQEEYLLLNSLEKASQAEDLIFLQEGRDCSFVYGNVKLKKAAKEITGSFFDGVILKSEALSLKSTTQISEDEKEKLSLIADYFVSEKKNAYIYCTAYLSAEDIASFRSFAHGVVIDLRSFGADKAESINSLLKNVRIQLGNREIIVLCTDKELLRNLDKESYDCVFVKLSSEADADNFRQLQLDLFGSNIKLGTLTDFSLYPKSMPAVEALKAHYALKDSTEMSKRAFYSYSDIKENKDNCFGAVRTYIEKGIAPILAFRELSFTDYDSEQKLTVNEPSHKIGLTASYLYPVYVNGKSAGTVSKGRGEMNLNLVRGENIFTFSQNGKELEYSVEYIFDGEIIKSVAPSDKIRVSPGEELAVLVVAHNEAEVYVKLGAKKYPAQKQDNAVGYTAFYAKIKMPADESELSSLGRISAVATMGGKTQQLDAAEISPVFLEYTPTTSSATVPAQNGTSYNIQNFNPTYIDVEQQVKPSINAAISKATTAYSQAYTGNQTAVVSAEYTDALPRADALNFIPSYTALAKGTKDFVVGETQFYDDEQQEWYYYYDLACGLMVSRDSVTLEPSTNMPENTLTVNSVYGNDGELVIRLGSTWKVPYTMEFPEQSYYSNNSYSYYVSEFNASAISLTFRYTTSVRGEIDCSASDVVSSATWSVSSENQTATLYLPLRERGIYNGYSIIYEGDETVITIKNRYKGLAGSVVVLDPGHGADDVGATGLSGSVRESDINILVAYQVRNFLQQQGVTVYMTRYGDDDINLEGRKIFARSVKPDLYVSIHSDAATNTQAIGSSAFYYKPFSYDLASNIHSEIINAYKNYFYAGRQDLYDDIDRGVKYYPFSVTRLDECPSVLIELGFMTNDAECYMLTVDQNQQILGQAIAKGICDTLVG